eukprot:1916996-Prymnesium_polylepis.1
MVTFDSKDGSDFMDEVAKVMEESNLIIERASAYLFALGRVSAAGTAPADELVVAMQVQHSSTLSFLRHVSSLSPSVQLLHVVLVALLHVEARLAPARIHSPPGRQANMAAGYLLSDMRKYVMDLEDEGVADHGDAEALVHVLEHDKHEVAKMFHMTEVLKERQLANVDTWHTIFTELEAVRKEHLEAITSGKPPPSTSKA